MIGAVIMQESQLIAAHHNEHTATGNPTAHAETLSLREAAAWLCHWRLNDCPLVVTLEPCVICAGAPTNARVKTIVTIDVEDSRR